MHSLTKVLDVNIQNQIDILVRTTGKKEETILREVVNAGLRNYPTTQKKGRKALLDLAKWAEENNVTGPKDLSTNHNKYAWGE